MLTKTTAQQNILIIKLGALGDFIQALGPMAAIRRAHQKEKIILLTTKPFLELAKKSGYCDEIWIDERPKAFEIKKWLNFRNKLNNSNIKRVYDLQNNDRTSLYLRLFNKHKKPEWVGAAKGASHRNNSPERTLGQAFDGHVQTLALAGITDVKIDELQWIKEDISSFELKVPYVILVPGSSPQHPKKRWPVQNFAALAQILIKENILPVIIGTNVEKEVAETIKSKCPEVENLCGKTTLFQIVSLAHNAIASIGNDTGPMHLIGATGCPSLVLFSGQSVPKRHAPKGRNIRTLSANNIADIEVQKTNKALRELISSNQTN